MNGYVISLCDYTGIFTKPWRNAGYAVIHVDPQRDDNGTILEMMPVIRDAIMTGKVKFVAGFPPCTELAVSGAAHFASKADKDKHFQAKAALVAEQCRMIGELSGAPWFFENPVSVLASIIGKPNYSFNPHEYGGYLPEDDEHPEWPEYIAARDAYPKKTCIWSGGGFVMAEPRRVGPLGYDLDSEGRFIEQFDDPDFFKGLLNDNGARLYDDNGSPVWGYSDQHKKLGGKSLRTKNIRSATPRGFAQAIFEKYGVFE